VLAVIDLVAVDTNSEVLCHLTLLNNINTNTLKSVAEVDEFLIPIEFATEL
jgi:hypothetical protein